MRWLRAPTLLADPNYALAGQVVTTDEYVGSHGGVGICFETGQAGDTAILDAVHRSCLDVLALEYGMIGKEGASTDPGELPRERYDMKEVFKLSDKGFKWAKGVGEENFGYIPRCNVIGYIGTDEFKVDYDSYMIFPKVESLWRQGGPLGWLAEKVDIDNDDQLTPKL